MKQRWVGSCSCQVSTDIKRSCNGSTRSRTRQNKPIMFSRLAAIDPKLLAFSLLLAAVSLYLLIKAKRPNNPRQRNESTTEAQVAKILARKEELIKRYREVEKACRVQDEKFLEEWEEMKVLARKYEEEVLNAGEDEWKVVYIEEGSE